VKLKVDIATGARLGEETTVVGLSTEHGNAGHGHLLVKKRIRTLAQDLAARPFLKNILVSLDHSNENAYISRVALAKCH
jgi:hypothetical protein